MVLSTGINRIRTAVFISGTGSNLKSLVKFSKNKLYPISINFLVSNNSKAKGLTYAKKLAFQNKNTFNFDTMVAKLDSIFTQYIPEIAQEVQLKLPKLKKAGESTPPKINLPKLKKV